MVGLLVTTETCSWKKDVRCRPLPPSQEIQGHQNAREGFWDDCRHPGPYHGMLFVPAATGLPVRSTAHFAKAEQSSALAAARDFRTNWSEQPTTSTCVYTAQSAGTSMIIPRQNSFIGQRGSRPAAQSEPSFISITITQPVRHETRLSCDAC
jgi:hypothetical protein